MQSDMASINAAKGFNTDETLIDEFEQWFKWNTAKDAHREKYQPLFAAFRNARVGLKLALVVGEIGEALEAVRKNISQDEHIPTFSAEEAEVADAFIRLMNYSTDRNLRVAEAIVAKNEYNRNRKDHSKEGRAAAGGKRF
jgi:NTP pyrophosphatase (non-canonical NTP hydrolase)